jgi:hypothetical protein
MVFVPAAGTLFSDFQIGSYALMSVGHADEAIPDRFFATADERPFTERSTCVILFDFLDNGFQQHLCGNIGDANSFVVSLITIPLEDPRPR